MSSTKKTTTTGTDETKSAQAYEAACRVLPGGVNSPVRAFGAVGGTPRFIQSAKGAILTDVDGNEYIDYVGSWGPMILGHADDRVTAAVSKSLHHGSSFGAPTLRETQLAEMVVDAVPSIELVRFVNSGTEATMSAIRLARAYTGRDIVVKIEGCYHGHVDALLVSAGSGATTFGSPSSPGVPEAVVGSTLTIPFNDPGAVQQVFDAHGDRIACLILEPVAGNMGCIPPSDGYLPGLRKLCDQAGSVLIFDEVMTGFRVAYGGAQALYGVTPDMTCLGKIIGGGLPVGAFGGRADIMKGLSPVGSVYQAGTLSGNPLAMAAGVAMLEALQDGQVYKHLEGVSARLAAGLSSAALSEGVMAYHTRVGSMLCTFLTEGPVVDYASAKASDTEAFGRFFHGMLERGVYLAPSQFECAFVSAAHDESLIDRTVEAAAEVFATL